MAIPILNFYDELQLVHVPPQPPLYLHTRTNLSFFEKHLDNRYSTDHLNGVVAALRMAISSATNPRKFEDRSRNRVKYASSANDAISIYLEQHVMRQPAQQNVARKQAALKATDGFTGLEKGAQQILGLVDATYEYLIIDLRYLAKRVFEGDDVARSQETLTELYGHLFAGGLRYARYARNQKDKKHQHVATAMGFGFALLGFAPIICPFAGLLDLGARALQDYFCQPKDAFPFIMHLHNNFIAQAAAVLQDIDPECSRTFRGQIADVVGATSELEYGRLNNHKRFRNWVTHHFSGSSCHRGRGRAQQQQQQQQQQ